MWDDEGRGDEWSAIVLENVSVISYPLLRMMNVPCTNFQSKIINVLLALPKMLSLLDDYMLFFMILELNAFCLVYDV